METIDKLFTAKDAIELTNEKSITIEGICKTIQNQASNGCNCVFLINVMMPFDVMNKIMELGFLMSRHTTIMGDNVIKISW